MGGGGVGGSKRKRPNDVVGEKIDMFVAPKWPSKIGQRLSLAYMISNMIYKYSPVWPPFCCLRSSTCFKVFQQRLLLSNNVKA